MVSRMNWGRNTGRTRARGGVSLSPRSHSMDNGDIECWFLNQIARQRKRRKYTHRVPKPVTLPTLKFLEDAPTPDEVT